MAKLPKIIIILGPTASGKTDLSLSLAKKFNGEIVNADSRTIYRGMYIGTASPFAPLAQKNFRFKNSDFRFQGVRHHLFHFIEPWESYSVSQYKKDAIQVITDILSRGKIPIMVGGTGLYIWSIVDNLNIPDISPQPSLRKNLELTLRQSREQGINKKGLDALWKRLLNLDPQAASFVQKDNPRRVIRALEVVLATGKKFSELRRKGKPLYNILQIGIKMPPEKLYKRINARVDEQMKQGLLGETKKILRSLQTTSPRSLRGAKRRSNLIAREVHSEVLENSRMNDLWQLPSMTSLGYRQMGMSMRGEVSPNEAIHILKRDTRRYARRQMTWFRRDKRIRWLQSKNKIMQATRKFLAK